MTITARFPIGAAVWYAGRPATVCTMTAGLIGGPHYRLAYTDGRGGGEDLTAEGLLSPMAPAAAAGGEGVNP